MKNSTFLTWKLVLVSATMFLFNSQLFSQWTRTAPYVFPTTITDKVGIGTATPTEKLQIVGGNVLLDYANTGFGNLFLGGVTAPNAPGTPSNGMRMSFYNSTGNGFKNGYIDVRTIGGTPNDGLLFRVDNTIGGTERMRICANGNIGIRATTPYKLFTVNGDVSFANYNNSGSGNNGNGFSGLEILGNNQVPTRRGISLDNDPNGSFNFYVNSNQGPCAFNFTNGNGLTTLMTINGVNGNVGIGTTLTSNPNNYKFAVNGTIGAKAVKVEITSTTWADFVFEKNYKLMPLNEIEKFININKHLPEIPSADEMGKNGLDVGEMMKLQMQKIEELTLYVIDLQKQVDEVKKENLTLKAAILITPKK